MAPIPVLVTRPEPGSSATAVRLRAMGLMPVLAPLLTIAPVAHRLPPADGFGAIVVASRHAVPPLPPPYRVLPLFAVGDATAEVARGEGFGEVRSAEGDAAALAALVARMRRPGDGRLLLAAGAGQGHYLARLLAQAGFTVERREVYAARPVAKLPEPARAMIRTQKGGRVLLFSRETALCLCRLIQGTDLTACFTTLDLAAISRSVSDAAGDLPWRSIRVAMTPTENAVLALLND
ncbi:MAG: uroporphyrinogen-III synthase [Proteobacteria bacterium]|nr:uroporphyrinogen-III synthase [Pseudomonadota bacterium]